MITKDQLQSGFRTRLRTDSDHPGKEETTLQEGPRTRDTVSQLSMRGNYISPNSYAAETLFIEYPVGSVTKRSVVDRNGAWVNFVYSGCVAFGSTVTTTLPKIDDSLYNTALNRLNAKTRGTLDLTLAISQAGSTARMLNATRRAESFVKTRPKSLWRDINRGISSTWLEFVYGWKPLAQDIYDAAQSLADTAIGAAQFEAIAGKTDGLSTIRFSFPDYGAATTELKGTSVQICSIHLVLTNDDVSFTRFGSVNPGSITWENVPYSFVVDWVYDISSYLRAMETALLLSSKFKSGYVVRSFKTVAKYHFTNQKVVTFSDRKEYYAIDATGTLKQTHHARQVLGSYPLPRMPTLNTEISVPRLFNLAALLASKIKRFVPK